MIYTQPDLPYAADALAPAISAETISFHYGKHEKAYIDNLNRLIEGTEFENAELEDIIRNAKGALFNNASQAWNHIFYFFTFSPDGGGEPGGRLREAIDRDFGSFDAFKKMFVDAGVGLFGSGWVWLQCPESADRRTDTVADVRRLGTRILSRLSEQTCRCPQRPLGLRRLGHCAEPILSKKD